MHGYSILTFPFPHFYSFTHTETLSERPVLDDEAPQVVVLKSKDMSLDQVHDAIDSGASLGDVHLATRTENDTIVDGDGNGDGAGAGAGAGAEDDSTKGAASSDAEKLKKKKKKKKKAGSKVPGALSKKLNKANKTMLSFDDDEEDDGW